MLSVARCAGGQSVRASVFALRCSRNLIGPVNRKRMCASTHRREWLVPHVSPSVAEYFHKTGSWLKSRSPRCQWQGCGVLSGTDETRQASDSTNPER